MIIIEKINYQELNRIQHLAEKTWEPTYKSILSREQLIYMFDKMYNLKTLSERIKEGSEFYIIKENNSDVGFTEIIYKKEELYISKIYIDPAFQKKGYGERLIEFIIQKGKEFEKKQLSLNVNRYNPAIGFYEKLQFKIIDTIDIEIGNGYLMEDYIMKKELF